MIREDTGNFDSVAGVLLAGGSGRRMGCDKALLPLGNTTLLQRNLNLLLESFSRVFLSGRETSPVPDVPTLPDLRPGCGPLGGIFTALNRFGGPVFILACDLPFFSRSALQFIVEDFFSQSETEYAAWVPTDGEGRLQPLCALYTPVCLPTLNDCLDQELYGVRDFLSNIPVRKMPLTDLPFYSDRLFQNLNTPDDYRQAGGAPGVRRF